MQSFKTHKGVIAVLDRANIDTDQIIAKQFLKSIKRTGYGEQLFFDWRYFEDGTPDPDFELNDAAYNNTSILVTGNNFGCGSSREHAVWAVGQYGIRVLIAPKKGGVPGFADIFHNNCIKNGILNIQMSEKEVEKIMRVVSAEKGMEAEVDLPQQMLILHARTPVTFRFEIDVSEKEYLLAGLDDIGLTMEKEKEISVFENTHNTQI